MSILFKTLSKIFRMNKTQKIHLKEFNDKNELASLMEKGIIDINKTKKYRPQTFIDRDQEHNTRGYPTMRHDITQHIVHAPYPKQNVRDQKHNTGPNNTTRNNPTRNNPTRNNPTRNNSTRNNRTPTKDIREKIIASYKYNNTEIYIYKHNNKLYETDNINFLIRENKNMKSKLEELNELNMKNKLKKLNRLIENYAVPTILNTVCIHRVKRACAPLYTFTIDNVYTKNEKKTLILNILNNNNNRIESSIVIIINNNDVIEIYQNTYITSNKFNIFLIAVFILTVNDIYPHVNQCLIEVDESNLEINYLIINNLAVINKKKLEFDNIPRYMKQKQIKHKYLINVSDNIEYSNQILELFNATNKISIINNEIKSRNYEIIIFKQKEETKIALYHHDSNNYISVLDIQHYDSELVLSLKYNQENENNQKFDIFLISVLVVIEKDVYNDVKLIKTFLVYEHITDMIETYFKKIFFFTDIRNNENVHGTTVQKYGGVICNIIINVDYKYKIKKLENITKEGLEIIKKEILENVINDIYNLEK
jgi:hypothetical protein